MPSLPWLKFFVSRWRASKSRMMLKRDERLLYLELIFALHEYEGAIPDDPEKLAMLANFPRAAFDACWPAVNRLFTRHPSEAGMITNAKALEIITEQVQAYERNTRQHKAAANARWGRDTHAAAYADAMQKGEVRREKKDLEERLSLKSSDGFKSTRDILAEALQRQPKNQGA